MFEHIYGLLVGIDRYPEATPPAKTPSPLSGCVNDIQVFKKYLEERFNRDRPILHLQELTNSGATRNAIVTGFREHLCQATSKDLAIFYYSGHGSTEKVSPEVLEYLQLPIDREHNLWETLICYDSRTESGYDLADKELAILVAEVSRNRPQIVIILDCCHSGGLFRNHVNDRLISRWFPNHDDIYRSISSYVFANKSIEAASQSANLDRTQSNWLPEISGDYILLAACRDRERAQEDLHQCRGVFSQCLTNTLYQANGRLSYRDIFNRTSISVRNYLAKSQQHIFDLSSPQMAIQSPQMIATNPHLWDRAFLGESNSQQLPYFTVYHDRKHGWAIDGGLVHGIRRSNSEVARTRLAVFPIDVEDIRQLSLAIATAETIEVLPQLSKLNIAVEKEPLNRELTYKAVVTDICWTPLGVDLTGNLAAVNLARQAIQTASFGKQSIYIQEVPAAVAEFQLNARQDEYTIINRGRDSIKITTETEIQAIRYLEHIARWKHIASLTSPATSRIPSNAVQIQIYHGEEDLEIQAPEIRLEYQYVKDRWKSPSFRVKLSNHSNETLYCTLLNLTQSYEVKSIPLKDNVLVYPLKPGEWIFAMDGKSIHACIPDRILQQGGNEYQDILKSICNTSEFDATLFEQTSIVSGKNRSTQIIDRHSPFDRLIHRDRLRAISVVPQKPDDRIDDWVTTQISIATVRPIR